jgi:hypothetical protein
MSFADTVNAQGIVPSGSSNTPGSGTNNPVKIGAVYNSSQPSLSTGEVADAQCDVNANLKVVVENGVAGSASGSPSSTAVITTQPMTGITYNFIAPATVTLETIKSTGGILYQVIAFNLLATPVYIKLFDATSVTLGTTACTYQFMVPGNTGGAGFAIAFAVGRLHNNAIKAAITLDIATTDDTNITANSVIVDFTYI